MCILLFCFIKHLSGLYILVSCWWDAFCVFFFQFMAFIVIWFCNLTPCCCIRHTRNRCQRDNRYFVREGINIFKLVSESPSHSWYWFNFTGKMPDMDLQVSILSNSPLCSRRKAVWVMLSPMDEVVRHIRFKSPNSSPKCKEALYQFINRLVCVERYRYNPITLLSPLDQAVSTFSFTLHSLSLCHYPYCILPSLFQPPSSIPPFTHQCFLILDLVEATEEYWRSPQPPSFLLFSLVASQFLMLYE